MEGDEENRLKTAVTNGNTVNFLYNAGGERAVKSVSNTREVLYVDKMYQKEIYLNDNCITKHIFLGDTRVATRVTYESLTNNAEAEKHNTYYYHPDHLGSSNFVTDYQAGIYEHLEYTPYGETWLDEGKGVNEKFINNKFTSKELDEETGLYYFGARYLDPQMSRWMSPDPALGSYLPNPKDEDEEDNNNEK